MADIRRIIKLYEVEIRGLPAGADFMQEVMECRSRTPPITAILTDRTKRHILQEAEEIDLTSNS